MNNSHRDKIVVIGAGNVGEAIAYTLMARVQANEIILIDLNEDRARGAALDIGHGTGFFEPVRVRCGGYEECADAKLIIITAGVARKPGQTRLDLAKINISIVKSITENIMEYAENPLILVVSNPVDIMTMAVQKVSGLPATRVFGSGTSLDTARLRCLLSQKLQVNTKNINAYVLGEHGDSQVPVFSSANIGGIPLQDFAAQVGIALDEKKIAERIKNKGAQVISLKGATFYGIAMVVSNIVDMVTKDNNAVIPATHVLDESFGAWSGVAVSLPCRIGRDGISQTLRIPMNEKEAEQMDASVKILRDFAEQAGFIK